MVKLNVEELQSESEIISKASSLEDETLCVAKEASSKSLQEQEESLQVSNNQRSSRKQSWRSKTWKRDFKSQRESLDTTSKDQKYSRKHSLTVPGEPYLQHHQQERKPVESKAGDVKLAKSKTPSPVSTPSPSGSLTYSRAGDEHSACSSCSSSGLDLEFARKCTVSADSLLLHPDIASISRNEGETRHEHSTFLDPELLRKRKFSTSISSDQIHKHSMFIEAEQVSAATKLPIMKDSAEAASSSAVSEAVRRKDSVTNLVLSGPGRIAKLLRRTHSAGCSKDVPSHALFLREKPMASYFHVLRRHHKSNLESDVLEAGSSHQHRKVKKHQIALEDMKQRLRFMRLRNTDSSLESSSVRPSPEEAEKWSHSFVNLMKNKYGYLLFKAFLAREFSQE
ncbi:regulator of G-protein signaling 12-like protein, partial [Dinothrombium tinctorium]